MLDQLDGNFLFGKLLGDKGYLSEPKREKLADQGIDLVTSNRRNMRQLLMKLGHPTS